MMPKYEIIKKDIIKLILDEKLKAGDKVYSEGEIKKIYNVSSTTAVKALNELVLSGYLIRKQGEGTYVRKNFKHKKVFFDEGSPYREQLQTLNKKNNEFTKFVSLTEIKDTEVSKKLGVSPSTKIIKIIRKGILNDKVWRIQYSYIPKNYIKNFKLSGIKEGKSLTDEINEQFNINFMTLSMKQHMEVVYPIKNIDLLDIWGISPTTPLFKIERTSFFPESRPYVYIENYIHYEYYSIDIQTE